MTERRSGQKQRRDVKVEPTHAVVGTGWVMKLKIGVMDQVGGPASIVKGISNIIETMEYVNSVRQKWNCDYDCGQHYNANGFYKNALTHHDIHIFTGEGLAAGRERSGSCTVSRCHRVPRKAGAQCADATCPVLTLNPATQESDGNAIEPSSTACTKGRHQYGCAAADFQSQLRKNRPNVEDWAWH